MPSPSSGPHSGPHKAGAGGHGLGETSARRAGGRELHVPTHHRISPVPIHQSPRQAGGTIPQASAAMWRNQRRPEVVEDFEREIYGRRPKSIPKVSWKLVNTLNETDGDVPIVTKQLLGVVDNSAYPAVSVIIQATVTTPAKAAAPVPVIIQFGGGAFPLPEGVTAPPNPCAPPGGFGARPRRCRTTM